MAFEIIKTHVHRLAVKVSCGCVTGREFEDARYKTPIGGTKFRPCDKHKMEGASTIEFILGEYLDTAVLEAQKVPTRDDSPVDAHGNKTKVISTTKRGTGGGVKRPTLSTAALPPRVPPQANLAAAGTAVDAMLASDDPSEPVDTLEDIGDE